MTTGTLHGHSVIVTGGGTGIGSACARLVAADGAMVTICGRRPEPLEGTADAIRRSGGQVQVIVADVTDENDVARLVTGAVDYGGGLHGVVANAGGGGGLAPYHRASVQEFQRVLALNVIGTFLCIKHSVTAMAESGGGSFIGMSSIAGHVTHPFFGAYPVAKAGIESMMKNAADEYGYAKIRFNALQPGFIATEAMAPIERGSTVWSSYVDQTPLGDVGEPEDVAHLVRFLLSGESRWITGQTIAIDGGNSLRRGPDYTSFVQHPHLDPCGPT